MGYDCHDCYDCEEKNKKMKEEIADDFQKNLKEFLNVWKEKENLEPEAFISSLIIELKIFSCSYYCCYAHMMINLVEVLNLDCRKMFEIINSSEVKNATCTL